MASPRPSGARRARARIEARGPGRSARGRPAPRRRRPSIARRGPRAGPADGGAATRPGTSAGSIQARPRARPGWIIVPSSPHASHASSTIAGPERDARAAAPAGRAPPRRSEVAPIGQRPVPARQHRGGQHHPQPRRPGRRGRGVPGQRVVQPLDPDLVGEPGRGQVDLHLRDRAPAQRPVEPAIQPGRGAAHDRAGRGPCRRPPAAGRMKTSSATDRGDPPRTSAGWPRPASPRPGGTSRPARSRHSLHGVELVEHHGRPAAGPGRVEGAERRDRPGALRGHLRMRQEPQRRGPRPPRRS